MKRLNMRETILKTSIKKDETRKSLFANEKISVFSRMNGKRKNENITVKTKKNRITR